MSKSKDKDHFTSYGAGVLARRIQAHWHKLGFRHVLVERYELQSMPGVFGVRSNLINGKPPRPRYEYAG